MAKMKAIHISIQPQVGQGFDPDSPLAIENQQAQALFDLQPGIVKRFIEAQAHKIAEAIFRKQPQVEFNLPDRVVLSKESAAQPVLVPAAYRQQIVGGVINRLIRTELRATLRQRLAELEDSPEKSVAVSAQLIRHAVAIHMVYHMLPSGRTVNYLVLEGEEIPTIPQDDSFQPESAITQASDAIVEEGDSADQRGLLQSPFVPSARKFYLPQWVAFDSDCRLLVKSVNEAEAHLASMQSYLSVLHTAVSIAPYIVADPVYQQKRYGMLGQLINQGRALAKYETDEMVATIKLRAGTNDLNRGLSLSMPFFDDQALEMRTHDFEVIPAGRIMFVPAFVVRAAHEEIAKVAQDTRLSPSTRKYLLMELKSLASAFEHK